MAIRFLKGIERWGRKNLSGFLRAILLGSQGSETGPPPDPERILVIRTDNRLGNLVLMEPLIASLSKRFPGASLGILVSERFSSVLEGHPAISRVWPAPKKRFIRHPLSMLRFFRDIRKWGPGVAIDASHPCSFSLSSAVAAGLSAAPCRVGWECSRSEGWYTCSPGLPADDGTAHESLLLQSLGSIWDGWPAWTRPCLPHAREAVLGERSGAIGIHVGARREKGYPRKLMAELAGLLSGIGELRVYWSGEEEREAASELATASSGVLMPSLSIEGLIQSISGLDAYVTPDNGTLHLASALGVPVVGLYRVRGSEVRYAPLSDGSVALLDEEGPAPEEVLAAVRRILAGRS
jgi:ADP-heptose:LPS heptosyltransferase